VVQDQVRERHRDHFRHLRGISRIDLVVHGSRFAILESARIACERQRAPIFLPQLARHPNV
jgi:hypothetical protein